jgi:IS30 family transposase
MEAAVTTTQPACGKKSAAMRARRPKSAIGTLVEASTRYVMLFACEKPTAENVRVKMTPKIMQLPGQFRKSIAWQLR